MEEAWRALVEPALAHEGAAAALRREDARVAARDAQRQRRAVVFITESPIARRFVDGRSDRFAPAVAEQEREKESLLVARQRRSRSRRSQRAPGELPRALAPTESSLVKRRGPCEARPQSMHALRRGDEMMRTLMRDSEGHRRPASVQEVRREDSEDLRRFSELPRSKREQVASTLLAVDRRLEAAGHGSAGRELALSKSLPALTDAFALDALDASETGPWAITAAQNEGERGGGAVAAAQDDDDDSDDGEDNFLQEAVVDMRAEVLRRARAEYVRQERDRQVERIKFERALNERMVEEIEKRREAARDAARREREREWHRRGAVQRALRGVRAKSQERRLADMRRDRSHHQAQRQALEERRRRENMKRIEELRARGATGVEHVPIPVAVSDISADIFPRAMQAYLAEEQALTSSRAFPPVAIGVRRVLGGGFRQEPGLSKLWQCDEALADVRATTIWDDM